ncbi:MAG: PspC domain-containing protein [Leucobacter sp.]
MNEHTSTSDASKAPFGSGFFAWLRQLGISRGTDRWFAGVAGGIAQRAGIDPIIVRGIFVVLALLGGPGILLYLAGWLLLPDQGGRIHLEEVFRGRAGTAAVVVSVAVGALVVLPLLSRLFGATAFGGWSVWNALGIPEWLSTLTVVLVWIVAITAAIILGSQLFLKHGRKVREEGKSTQPGQPAQSAQSAASFTVSPSGAATSPGTAEPFLASEPRVTTGSSNAAPAFNTDHQPGAHDLPNVDPPNVDPPVDWSKRIADQANDLNERAMKWSEGVGKQTDEWSARYAEHHDTHRLGAAHVVITLALAMLAAGGAALWSLNGNLLGTDGPHTEDPAVMSVLIAATLGATVVFAISLIIAGIRGRYTGWVGFLSFCGVITLIVTTILPWGTQFQPFGIMDVSNHAPGAALIAGSTRINVDDFATNSSIDEIEVWHLAGNSVVTVPDDEPTIVTVRLLAGNISGPTAAGDSGHSAGPFLNRTFDLSDGDTKAERVTVYMLAGNVRVFETDAAKELTR